LDELKRREPSNSNAARNAICETDAKWQNELGCRRVQRVPQAFGSLPPEPESPNNLEIQ
jgi:hypothetical protein